MPSLSGKAKVVSGVRALDSRRVQITLNNITPYFPALAAMWPYWAVDKNSVIKNGTNWVNPPNLNATGAFRLTAHHRFEVRL